MMSLQELAYALGLTNLQIVALNDIGAAIKYGKCGYLSCAENLSQAEDTYLRHWLCNEGIAIKEEGSE